MAEQTVSTERAKAQRKQVLASMLRVIEGRADEAEREQIARIARQIDARDQVARREAANHSPLLDMFRR